jgi:tetratricopeptide (TPR) repeat protein
MRLPIPLGRERGRVRLALALAFTTGCATAPETFGTRARFSPAYNGYVMAPDNGSDDPETGQTALLLRDPLTGQKLRCREDVVAWRELHEDLAADLTHDENVAVAVGVTTGAVFAPLVVVEPVGAVVLAEAMLTADLLYADLSSDDATELLAAGIVLYKRHRFRQAATVIERALAKDGSVGVVDKAYLYLGLSYVELHNATRARLALSMFLDRAGVRDVDAYREADRALESLGVEVEDCESTEPVDLHW